MAKKTKTPEQLEWEAGREWREQFILRRMVALQRELQERETRPAPSTLRRRLFPWRIRLERL